MAKTQIIIGRRVKSVEKKAADFLVKIGKARYADVPVKDQTYQTRMMVAENPQATKQNKVVDGKEELKRILDAAGVQYDGRLGEAKLRELVASIKE